MAGSRKHGAHRYNLSLPTLSGSSTTDAWSTWAYDAFADGAATSTGYLFPYDVTAEQVVEAYFTVGAAWTGQATNFAQVAFQLYRGSTAATNDIRVGFSGTGITGTVGTPANLNVASGGAVTGAGTGVLLVSAGAVLPWTLQQGDILAFARITTANGQATPAMNLTFITKQLGS